MSTHAAQSPSAQGPKAFGAAMRAPFEVIDPAPSTQNATRSQLHAELRATAGAIPIPLKPGPNRAPQPITAEEEPDGTTLRTITAPGSQQLREPNLPELMWLSEMRVHLYHPADPPPTAQELSARFDDFCVSWHTDPAPNRWDCTYAVASLGVGLGDLLVQNLPGAQWTISENGDATTLAVRDNTGRVTYLPLDSVARRWHAHQLDWIEGFIEQSEQSD